LCKELIHAFTLLCILPLCAHGQGCVPFADSVRWSGNHAMAVDLYSLCIETAPDYAPAFGNRAISLLALGRLAEAEADCRQALLLNPEEKAPLFILIDIQLRAERFDEVLSLTDSLLQIHPDFGIIHFRKGQALLAKKRRKDACLALEKAAYLQYVDAVDLLVKSCR
jgi:tetratricopeptide (TPR) repeat protein